MDGRSTWETRNQFAVSFARALGKVRANSAEDLACHKAGDDVVAVVDQANPEFGAVAFGRLLIGRRFERFAQLLRRFLLAKGFDGRQAKPGCFQTVAPRRLQNLCAARKYFE